MTGNSGWTIRPAAQTDLSDIWRHGTVTWGPDQADALFALFDLLAEFPEMARARAEFTPPVRIQPNGSHLVIYQQVGRASRSSASCMLIRT